MNVPCNNKGLCGGRGVHILSQHNGNMNAVLSTFCVEKVKLVTDMQLINKADRTRFSYVVDNLKHKRCVVI
jgi:hypothetical protein